MHSWSMRINSLHLEHFRSYTAQAVKFGSSDIQLFVGKNGSGKTNLLEALSVLSLTKSCRGKDDNDMVQWDASHYRVRAELESDTGEKRRLEVVCDLSGRKRKALFSNDVRLQAPGYIGLLPTVTFLPQDLLLFSGPPAERRRFLDQLLCQISPDYLTTLSHFQKVVQQRNALLRRIAAGEDHRSSLDIWDRELSGQAARVTIARLELLQTLNVSFTAELSTLGEAWQDADLRYERKTTAQSEPDLSRELLALLEQNRERDVLLHSTSVGPHREDWQAYRDNRPIPSFASRGQERTAILAMLLLEVSYLELRRNEKPVILLDDAFSELDDDHQAALLDRFRGHQVIMTSTRVPPNAQGSAVFSVEKGIILEGAQV